MNKYLLLIAISLFVMAGCDKTEIYDKDTTEIENDIDDLKDAVTGLKISDQVFGFVSYAQHDTVTKGLPYAVIFRVNPSGVPFTQDMVVLDNMSAKRFIYTPETMASYITESTNFKIDSMGVTQNEAKEDLEGQYFIRMKSTETRNMIEDDIFSLVGGYRDKEEKIQYVSSTPFSLVMMPTPEEGLTKWSFIRGNVTHGDVKTTVVPGSDPEETVSTWEVTLGSIAVSFDRRLYVNEKDKNDTRTYSTKYISSFVWEGNSKADSIVIFEPHRDSAYVKFLPDTSKPEWQALMDTTKFNTLTVKGKVHAFDRYGGRSVFPVEMVWYSRYRDTVTLNLKVSDFIQENPDGSTTRKTYEYDLTSALEKLGYKESEVESTPRKKVVHGIITGPGSKVLMAYSSENNRVIILRSYVPKAALVGTHYNIASREIKTFPSEKDPVLEMSAIECPLVLKIVITE